MAGRRAATADRFLPDALVVGQRLEIFGRLLLVLAVLEQGRARVPEDRAPLTVGKLGERPQLQLARVRPGVGRAHRRVLVLGVIRDLPRGELVLIRGVIDTVIGVAGVEYVNTDNG